MNIPLLSPDVNASYADFAVELKEDEIPCVRYALAAIKNVGYAAMEHLVEERLRGGPFKNIWDLVERIEMRVINRRQLENLILAGAFDSLHENRRQLYESIDALLQHASTSQNERQSPQTSLFGTALPASPVELQLHPTAEWLHLDRLQKEFEAIGFYLSAHPLDAYGGSIKRLNSILAHAIDMHVMQHGSTEMRVMGVILNKKERVGKNGQKYAFVQLSDPTGVFEVTLFSEQLSRSRDLIEPGKTVLLSVNGRKDGDSIRLTVGNVEDLESSLATLQSCHEIILNQAAALAPLQTLLSQTPRGRTKLVLRLNTPDHTVLLHLSQSYAFTAQMRSAIQQFPGIMDIQEQ